MGQNYFDIKKEMKTPFGKLKYYSLKDLDKNKIKSLPFSIRILLENAIRNCDGFCVTHDHIDAIYNWQPQTATADIPYMPARVLMQDFTGVPAVVDIASIRAEAARRNIDLAKTNPRIPVDLIIDHSVQVDYFGTDYAYQKNVDIEYERNTERYSFLKWASKAFKNFKVLPPGMGICHQVNLEYLAKGVIHRDGFLFPDTLVGTDSHTPMINGIGVIGWGVGGIEAEAAILGQPIIMLLPPVVGLKFTGDLRDNVTATDLVLEVTEKLRKHGVVGKFVEAFGQGLNHLSVTDRATISNMSPEFGCTVTYFPIDEQTLMYMKNTTRTSDEIQIVEQYTKQTLLWRQDEDLVKYSSVVEIDLNKIYPAISGPKRPQDKIFNIHTKKKFSQILKETYQRNYIEIKEREDDLWAGEGGCVCPPINLNEQSLKLLSQYEITSENNDGLKSVQLKLEDVEFLLSDGAVVLAAITSCTNTSNPSVMIAAGLLAKKAVEKGIHIKPWVKTSLAPGSRVVSQYLKKANLLNYLEALNFHVVGYGCTTCIGNSGQLPPHIDKAIKESDLIVASVLSGNRNFEARIHPNIKMNFLMSPPMVIAYAITGRLDMCMIEDPLTYDPNGNPIYLKDVWPSKKEIMSVMKEVLSSDDFQKNYATAYDGDNAWQNLSFPENLIFKWDEQSTYIKEAPFFKNLPLTPIPVEDISPAKALLVLGDSITTDHISPAGAISPDSAAGVYLQKMGIKPKNFNSYGSRRGNHEVMMRGTFANVRLKNKLVDKEGGYTIYHPNGELLTVFDAACKYKKENTHLIVLAGKEYGSGSSRDWAAKGTYLLGIKAVIAQSYERIHRSNLVGMGVLPLQFKADESYESLGLTGHETFHIKDINNNLEPAKEIRVLAVNTENNEIQFNVVVRLDSLMEIYYYKNGGILQYVLRHFLKGV